MWRIWAQKSNFRATLGHKISKYSVVGHFLEHFPLVSHQSWFTCQLGLLLEVCWGSASKAQFLDHSGPQNREYIKAFSHFLKYSLWFHILCVSNLIGGMYVQVYFNVNCRLQWSLLGRQVSCYVSWNNFRRTRENLTYLTCYFAKTRMVPWHFCTVTPYSYMLWHSIFIDVTLRGIFSERYWLAWFHAA